MLSGTSTRRRLARALASLTCLVVGAELVPRHLVGRSADAWFADDRVQVEALADAVAERAMQPVSTSAFHTGSARFDGEWAMGTQQMTVLGLSQAVLAHPELRDAVLPALDTAAARLRDDTTFAFATDAWGRGPWASLDEDHGHGYLGYVALALGSLREVDPHTRHAAAHDALVAALVRRIEAHPMGIVQTYPGEAYPCDIAAIVGAIAQHGRITGVDRSALVQRMAAIYRAHWIDADSGYLVQSLRRDGTPLDAPRASGTALAAYFWSFADAELTADLDAALLDVGATSVFGFGAIREYAPGHDGHGDIDSGPVVLGVSVSATGFALSAARRRHDADRFHTLMRTTELFGIPEDGRFVTGGPLGNAILLAMLTARRS